MHININELKPKLKSKLSTTNVAVVRVLKLLKDKSKSYNNHFNSEIFYYSLKQCCRQQE